MTSKQHFRSKLFNGLRQAGYVPAMMSGNPDCGTILAFTQDQVERGETTPAAIVSGPNDETSGRRYGVMAESARQQEIFGVLDPIVAKL